MSNIKGKTLVLTGASGGIGTALALQLAQSGVNLVLNSRHSGPLRTLAKQCEEQGVNVGYLMGNAAEREIAWEIVHTAVKMGGFYGFIHLAGVLHPGPLLWELPLTGFREVFDASVVASYQMIRFAIPELIKAGEGVAVFFGSGAAERNVRGMGAYSCAKSAEEHMAKQLAAEAPQITSFIYRPGVVETGMTEEAFHAVGSAASELQRQFAGYKERGELLTPDQAARPLVSILNGDPRRFHGKVATWRDVA